METVPVSEIVGELFIGLYCEMENSMTAAKACRNTSTVRHERSAGISNDRDFHRSFSMISLCFSVVCPRSMRCRSSAFCALNCRIASFRSLMSACRSASAFRFSADVFGTFGDRFGRGLRIAWMIRVPLPGCDDGCRSGNVVRINVFSGGGFAGRFWRPGCTGRASRRASGTGSSLRAARPPKAVRRRGSPESPSTTP